MHEILITNDDGFEARGLLELASALRDIAHITIVAPSSQKSACSHSLTLTRPLRFIAIGDDFYKLDDATPSDCVYLALQALYSRKPDLVISGINHGANIAEDITYSGTCGGAMEGVLQGIPAIAISQYYSADSLGNYGFSLACKLARNLVKKIFSQGFPLPPKQFLNLNVPAVSASQFLGLKCARLGEKFYGHDATLNRNPRGEEYYWLGNAVFEFDSEKNAGSDIDLLMKGYATLSPVQLNLTANEQLKGLEEWIMK
ncbi:MULTISPECIES: 5'/3'-nucleotidase SurE [unclassified Campylobacter]|uniref:5'/3'-nucleotidase SurE n=1 Tax=unclassified Campylobacter TaxID=2593542 RepID=UPI0022E9C338|nr:MULTISPECIES: 5'/3'-nucleotidase SurE [unclassified Campylobacter]MDA3055276.1 5'/3'-nucleotidase SurE [Campylobacter sp. VBCF_07 NA4]MDA3061528.1 5'/3'-nucleotidase SurE [Campylobacter sp. VBCF_02 NA5]MDA3071045.1 5'/3'-nucleotidase SurE [Campylobacter sp. VBCF_08 NA3]